MDNLQKIRIAKEIKNISLNDSTNDFISLQNCDLEQISSLSRIGFKFLDYYFYVERLSTVGKKGISFYSFVENFELYRTVPYINRLYLNLRHKHPSNFYKCAKEIFQLYFGSINAFRPIVAMKI